MAAGIVALLGAGAIGGTALMASAQTVTATNAPAVVQTSNSNSGLTSTIDKPESSSDATDQGSAAEVKGTEADGPGGHQDPAGVNVDHQFEGKE